MDYYIVNLSHHTRQSKYITVWRADNNGYAWPLSWAGRYPETLVKSNLDYYNSGENVAVPCSVLDALAVEPDKGDVDGNAGPVVRSTKEAWGRVLANLIEKPKYPPKPQYPRVNSKAMA